MKIKSKVIVDFLGYLGHLKYILKIKNICTKTIKLPSSINLIQYLKIYNMLHAFLCIFVQNGICQYILWQNSIKLQYL